MSFNFFPSLIAFIAILEPIFKIMTCIALISVSYKGMQALNIYIRKNTR